MSETFYSLKPLEWFQHFLLYEKKSIELFPIQSIWNTSTKLVCLFISEEKQTNNKYSKVLNFHTAKFLSVVFSHFKIKVLKMSEEKSSNVLKPGAIIRPFLSLETAIEIIENLYGLKAFGLKEYIRFIVGLQLLWNGDSIIFLF